VRPRHARAGCALLLWAILCAGCSRDDPAPQAGSEPTLPRGAAGDKLRRAMAAAGGWERWKTLSDVAYISTLNILDARRQVSSESIGWYKAPLHRGALARKDSIGLPNEVLFGIHGDETWILSDGRPVLAPGQLALTRFDMVSNLFWFSLPFLLAEMPATVTDLGTEESAEEERTFHRLKVVFEEPNPAVPGKWFVLYFDDETWLIDRVHAQLTAPFLRHELWLGKWLRYRELDGLKKERQRQFFPANDAGQIVGNLVAEQFVEHVRFNNGFAPSDFLEPKHADAEPVGAPGHGVPHRLDL
jgi:hypothetical protein